MRAEDFPLWHFRATGYRAIDGDTVRVAADLGFGVQMFLDLRIAGIDAPEMVGADRPAAEAARKHLAALIAGQTLYVRTHKDRRSFARYVADIGIDAGNDELEDVAETMVASGHAQLVGKP